MMKLIVQIPCLNEAETLTRTVADIPRAIPGIDSVQILIIDDGSSDDTLDVARRCGVDFAVQHTRNLGLAQSFQDGLEACLQLGADIIVNTDGDNQYAGASIPDLVQLIVQGKADMVIGDRCPTKNPEFSLLKRILQGVGSSAVRCLSGVRVPDAVSGFRAFSREAASRLIVLSRFSYSIETIIQAGYLGYRVQSVPVKTNRKTRESRLFRGIPHFLYKSGSTLLRVYLAYSPLRCFAWLSAFFGTIGAVPILRFLYLYVNGNGAGHIQSLVLGGAFLVISIVLVTFGLLAELVSWNRRMLEQVMSRVRNLEQCSRDTISTICLQPPDGMPSLPSLRETGTNCYRLNTNTKIEVLKSTSFEAGN